MTKLGFWSRIGGWIRRGERQATEDSSTGNVEGVDEARTSAGPSAGADGDDASAAERITAAVSRRGRREVSLSKLQEGYDRVLDMMDQLQTHMQTQESTTEQISEAMTQLSRSLSDLPSLNRQQAELLSAIAAQLETSTVRTQQLSDAIGELPRVTRQQTEALSGVQRQLEMGAEADVQLSSSMQSFGRSIDKLGDAAESQTASLNELHVANADRHAQLDEILHRQTRQFTILVAITAILAGAAIVVGTIAVVMQMGS